MIRTLIEVTGDTEWDHERKLKAALDQLGFEPKENSRSNDRLMGLLHGALRRLNLDPYQLAADEDVRRAQEQAKLNG